MSVPDSIPPVPPQTGYDSAQDFPAVRPITAPETVGPEAENERLAQLAKRDLTLRERINAVVLLLNYFLGRGYGAPGTPGHVPGTPDGNPVWLARNGTTPWLSGALDMMNSQGVRHKIVELADATNPYDAMNQRSTLDLILKNIPSSLNFDTSDFLRRSGILPWAGPDALNMASFQIVQLGTATAPHHAVPLSQVQSLIATAGSSIRSGYVFNGQSLTIWQTLPAPADVPYQHKEPCAVSTTTNVNLASPGAAINGVTLTNGMRVLVRAQSNAAQNGIYTYNGAALVRATDMDTWSEVPRAYTRVLGGTQNAGLVFFANVTNFAGTIGTTVMPWAVYTSVMSVPAVSITSPWVFATDYIYSLINPASWTVSGVEPGTWQVMYWMTAAGNQNTQTNLRVNVNAASGPIHAIVNGTYKGIQEWRPVSGVMTVTVPAVGLYANEFNFRPEFRVANSPALATFMGLRGFHYLAIKVA